MLDEAMGEANMTRAEMARRLGRKPAQVSQWVTDGNRHGPPDPDTVFAIEDALGCRDMLARVLGYVRADDVTPSVETAVAADEDLTPDQKELLAIQLTSMRQAARDQRSRRSRRRS